MNLHTSLSPLTIPLVVQIGFAGSRSLFDPNEHPEIDASAFDGSVLDQLTELLRRLPQDLDLSDQHFLCGISQMAVGADMIFSRVCNELTVPQQLFLPQHREDYLAAIGSHGIPDFSPDQQRTARLLMDSPHVIQERVVSDAAKRSDRFEDVNLEIVRFSDLLVCLLRETPDKKPGGTRDLVERARKRGKPVLEITVCVENGQPVLRQAWHGRSTFTNPRLPHFLSGLVIKPYVAPGSLPDAAEYIGRLKAFTSDKSKERNALFKGSAFFIIGTHVIATVCAVLALQVHQASILPALLLSELLLLVAGFSVHEYLHRSESSQVWAVSRLVAELTRSILAVGKLPIYLDYLFNLPFQADLLPLLRTLNVLHLRSSGAGKGLPWELLRDDYLKKRLTDPNAQLEFYARKSMAARQFQTLAQRTFVLFSVSAMIATVVKLLANSGCLPMLSKELTSVVGGSFAIVFPVLAVASLSLAAAFDLKARAHTFADMLVFLEAQKDYLTSAISEREFAKLLIETESRLLGETVIWFSRRWFTGVA